MKVDSFLNHQMDIELFNQMGEEYKKRFEGKEINKILTIEASGIGIACVIGGQYGYGAIMGAVLIGGIVAVVFVAAIVLNLVLPKKMDQE